MDNNLFGSEERYSMLSYIHNNIREYDDNKRKYFTCFVNEFNLCIKDINGLTTKTTLRNYLLGLVRKDYENKTDELFDKYDTLMVTHLKNYIYARTKPLTKLKLK